MGNGEALGNLGPELDSEELGEEMNEENGVGFGINKEDVAEQQSQLVISKDFCWEEVGQIQCRQNCR